MINCQYQQVVLKYGLNLKVEFWQNSWFRHQSLLNLHLFACFIRPDMDRAVFPAYSLSQLSLLMCFSYFFFSTSCVIGRVVCKRKFICYKVKVQKLIYLIMLAVFLI